jgi:hypothetical protein
MTDPPGNDPLIGRHWDDREPLERDALSAV